MRKALALVWLLFPCLAFSQAFTTVTATNVLVDNGSGTAVHPPAGSSLCFLGVNTAGAAITYAPAGGSPTSGTVCQTLTSGGALTGVLQVANPATASPNGLLYTITVINGGTTYLTIPTASFSGTLFNFNNFALPGTGLAVGIGKAHLTCANGAQWTSTTLPPGQNNQHCNSSGLWDAYPPALYCPSGQAYNVPQQGGTPFCLPPVISGNGAPSGTCTQNETYFQQDTTSLYICKSAAWVLIASSSPGVISINGAPGSFTFTGPGVSCASTTCTFSGGSSVSLTTNGLSGLPSLAGAVLNVTPNFGGNAFQRPNIDSLVGAFTDSSGNVIQPVALGNGPTTFYVPHGATQLQLGVNDDILTDQSGSWTVTVNGTSYTVSSQAPPWVNTGGINPRYPINVTTSTAPMVAAIGVEGTPVVVTYVSGLITDFALCGVSGTHTYDASGQANCAPSNDGADVLPGYWTAFAAGSGSGNGITALTGDVLATGPGSVAAVLASSGVIAGTYTCANITVNIKGILTSAANGVCGSGGFSAGGDLTGSSTSQTVVGIRNIPVPTPATGYLYDDGSALHWAPNTAGIVTTATSITASCQQIIRADSSSAITLTLPAITAASGSCPISFTRGVTAGAITVATGGPTFDGPTGTQQPQGLAIVLWTDGTNWHSTSPIVAGTHCTWTPGLTGSTLDCAGGGINQLTGDGTAGPGSGSQAFTLATVNSNVGACGDATHVSQVTLNAKGLTTACTPVAITGGGGGALDVFLLSTYGGVGDGNVVANTGTDNLTAFNSAISAAAANGGGIIQLQCGKQYLVSGVINVTSSYIRFASNCLSTNGSSTTTVPFGTTVFVNNNSSTVVDFHGTGTGTGEIGYVGSDGVSWYRGNTGTSPAAASKTVSLSYVGGLTLNQGVAADSVYDVYLGPDTAAWGTGLVSNFRTVNGCVATYSGQPAYYGFYIDGSTTSHPSLRFDWIHHNSCLGSSVHTEGFYSIGQSSSDISVSHLETALDSIGLHVNCVGGGPAFSATDQLYTNMVIDGSFTSAVKVENCPYTQNSAIVISNSWLNAQPTGTNNVVDIESSFGVTLSNNQIYQTDEVGNMNELLYLLNSIGIIVSNNQFFQGYVHAYTEPDILCSGTNNSVISGNTFNSPSSGNTEVKLQNCSYNSVGVNIFQGTAAVGISADASSSHNRYLPGGACGSGITTCLTDSGTDNQAGTTTNPLTFNNSGTGDVSGSTFNGSAAKTLSYNSIGAAPSVSPVLTGTPDASGATQFKLPVAAGYASAAQGEIGYDPTNKNWHGWVNGADTLFIPLAASFVSGDCAQPTLTGTTWTLVDVGGPCGVSGGGSAWSTITAGTNTHALVMGSGGSLATSGTATIDANKLGGVPLCTGFTPTNGQNLQYTTASSPNPCYTAAAGASGGFPMTFVQSASFSNGSGTFTYTFPSALQASGTTAFLMFVLDENAAFTTPSGWTKDLDVSNGTLAVTSNRFVLIHKASAGDTTVVLTPVSGTIVGQFFEISGSHTLDTSSVGNSGTTNQTVIKLPSITPSSGAIVFGVTGTAVSTLWPTWAPVPALAPWINISKTSGNANSRFLAGYMYINGANGGVTTPPQLDLGTSVEFSSTGVVWASFSII